MKLHFRIAVMSAAVTLLVGCAEAMRAMDYPPDKTWASASALDPATACVVAKMREGYRSASINFVAGIVVPNSVYEIRPDRPLTLGADPLVVRVSKITDQQTRIELFAIGLLGTEAVPSLEKCLA